MSPLYAGNSSQEVKYRENIDMTLWVEPSADMMTDSFVTCNGRSDDESYNLGSGRIKTKVEILRDAIVDVNVAAVKKLLAEGVSVWQCVGGSSLLICFHCSKRLECLKEAPPPDFKNMSDWDTIIPIADTRECGYCCRYSPLYWAIKYKSMEIVEALVCAGARLEHVGCTRETALHVSVRFGRHRLLKYFLKNMKKMHVLSTDKNGCTAMHYAAWCCEQESVKLLLQNSKKYYCNAASDTCSILNVVDNIGESPIYKSSRMGNDVMTNLLLCNGAALSLKGEKETAILQISRNFHNPLMFLEQMLNECIVKDIYNEDNVSVNFKNLACCDGSQIKVIEDLTVCGGHKLLKHPVIESLIFLNWTRYLPLFYSMIAVYLMFLILFNTLVITKFNMIDTSNGTLISVMEAWTKRNEGARICWLVSMTCLYIIIGVLFFQEFVWIYLQRLRYFSHLESWLKMCTLLLAMAVAINVLSASTPFGPWQRHLTCLSLLLAWWRAMLLLSRFTGWGYYFLMFERVAINILKILVAAICLLVGFSICFMIQYQSKPPFNGLFVSIIKTFVMMSSEFDYENLFNKDHDEELKHTKTIVRLLFGVFEFVVAIVLMNFMIGVAVSDIGEIVAIGKFKRLEKQVELLSVFRSVFKKNYISIRTSLSKQIREWEIFPRKKIIDFKMFPSELASAIIEVAMKKKKNNRNISSTDEQSDIMSTISYTTNSAQNILYHNETDNNRDSLSLHQYLRDDIIEIKQSIDELKSERFKRIEFLKDDLMEIIQAIDELKRGLTLNKEMFSTNHVS